jgi:hypothetical protein
MFYFTNFCGHWVSETFHLMFQEMKGLEMYLLHLYARFYILIFYTVFAPEGKEYHDIAWKWRDSYLYMSDFTKNKINFIDSDGRNSERGNEI